jgi:cell filamentation protein
VIDPYCWPGTECLRNHLDIRDPEELAEAEHEVAGLRYAGLGSLHLPGAYNTAHLVRFHQALFGEIYPWAGEIRNVEISKSGRAFCRALFVEDQLASLFGALAEDRHLIGLERAAFTAKFAALHGELNAIHPFREGNGRTQRAFLRQLAAGAGWTVAWESLEKAANDSACFLYRCTFDPEIMVKLLESAITPRAA